MYYESGTVERTASEQPTDTVIYAAASAWRTLHVHSPDGNIFLREMK